jgi:hypothetical protein
MGKDTLPTAKRRRFDNKSVEVFSERSAGEKPFIRKRSPPRKFYKKRGKNESRILHEKGFGDGEKGVCCGRSARRRGRRFVGRREDYIVGVQRRRKKPKRFRSRGDTGD